MKKVLIVIAVVIVAVCGLLTFIGLRNSNDGIPSCNDI
jgi:uncharacterized protein YxeA